MHVSKDFVSAPIPMESSSDDSSKNNTVNPAISALIVPEEAAGRFEGN